jgi:D-alanyl-D-alanine carboxypeptidase/D-alanyl-D-alanine-endopeptidase (penicillin-binding protein 4)
MNESPYGQQFKNSLPFGGKRGSRLEGRLVYAGNKIRAKTGSLSGVSALSGYIESNSLGPLAFSIIINGFTGSSDPFRKLQDDICKFLVMN